MTLNHQPRRIICSLRCPTSGGRCPTLCSAIRDTLLRRVRGCSGRTHGKEIEVSGVSHPFSKTIAYACTGARYAHDARVTRLSGFARTVGHPGHPGDASGRSRRRAAETVNRGVRPRVGHLGGMTKPRWSA